MIGNSHSTERSVPWLAHHAVSHAGALVVGNNWGLLAVVRSLGRQNIPVWVLSDEPVISSVSRYTQRTLSWSGGGKGPQVDYLLNLAVQHGLNGWALYPGNNGPAAMIAQHHATLMQYFQLATPPWEILRWADDKRFTYRLAADLGIDHPPTYYPANRDEVAALDCSFPAILKPAIKQKTNRFTQAKFWLVADRRELLTRYDEACHLAEPSHIMVQEFIPGGGQTHFSYAALCLDGHPIASLVAWRPRHYPTGWASYVVTVEQPVVEASSRRMLAAIHYTGLAELEFMYDARDGCYRLLDFNPRVWGWNGLGGQAGVDFPYLLWQLIHGEQVPETRARTGVHWVHMWRDMAAVIREMRCGKFSLGAYIHSLRGSREWAIFAPDDPVPALVELPQGMYRKWKRSFAWLPHVSSSRFAGLLGIVLGLSAYI